MILGLDLGTTNVKALLIDENGRIESEGFASVERYYAGTDGVEQDIEEIWRATIDAVRLALTGSEASQVRAVGVSSQGGAMQILDAEDRPVGRVISWLDGRGRPYDDRIEKDLKERHGDDFFAKHLGYGKPAISIGQIARLKEESPHIMGPKCRIGFVGDIIVGRLCGHRAHDATSLSIALLLNPRECQADAAMLDYLDIHEQQLPDLLPVDTAAGRLTTDIAQDTGLPPGIPVSVAIHDQYAASLGAGSVGSGNVSLGTGTAWVLVANSDTFPESILQSTFVCPHPVDGLFGQMKSLGNGGSAVEWAMGIMSQTDLSPSGTEMDYWMRSVPVGSEGLAFWPLLTPGIGYSAFEKSGGRMTGIRLSHGPQHVLRAVVEGLACELARHLNILTEGGVAIDRLVMSGAAAASNVTPEIIANVVGCPVACLEESSISAFGAGVAARALVEPEAKLADLARELAPASRTVEPGKDMEIYQELLQRYIEPF
ncbi:MAG: FGGY-family carbohydrate kinase [Pirellulales bacterium]|nr:FGGY-family carbohydrate kinase [Pirellulales bacterium]